MRLNTVNSGRLNNARRSGVRLRGMATRKKAVHSTMPAADASGQAQVAKPSTAARLRVHNHNGDRK